MKKILYIGNNLTTKNPTTLVMLSQLLREKGFNVVNYSDKSNKFLRLLDMCFGVLKHHKADYLLIDTYSTSNFYFAFFTSQLARIFSLKYIPILHGGNLPARLKKSPKMSNLIFKNVFVNVAPSNYLQSVFKKNRFDVINIPNGIELKKYPFKQRKIESPKLFWLRAFDEIYNPTMAIEVFKKLKKEYPQASLCMVGADKDGSLIKITSLVNKYNLSDSVLFTGQLPKNEWMEKSKDYNVFLNTTNFDNTPVSVIEAMALGLPVVSTDVGGIPYLISDTKDGLLVPPNDIDAMVNSIVKLVENPDLVKSLTINARLKVESFDAEKVLEQWKKILESDVV